MTERYFTLSVVGVFAEGTNRQRKGKYEKHSHICRPAWLEIDRNVCTITTTTSYIKRSRIIIYLPGQISANFVCFAANIVKSQTSKKLV